MRPALVMKDSETAGVSPQSGAQAGEFRRGFMFVLSSPSGAGKTTLSRMLLERERDLVMSVSATTRPMRPGEVEGIDYHFADQPEFDGMVASGELLEHAHVFGHSYGTPKSRVGATLDSGTDMLFDIDWQGTRQLSLSCRPDLVSIFILPPSMEELERRLRMRAQDSDEIVAYRMAKAADEIRHWEEYDYVVVNRDLHATLDQITHILKAERLRRTRQTTLPEFVATLCR